MAGFSGGVPIGPSAPAPPRPTPPRSASKPSKSITVRSHTRAAPQRGQGNRNPQVAPGLRANSPVLNPATPLSGAALYKAAQGLADAEVNPTLTALRQQIAQNNRQTQGAIKLTGGYYNQLEPFVSQGVTDEQNIASGLNSTLANIGQNTQTQLGQIGQNALSSLLKYAPQGDGGIANAATSDLAAQIARQQGLAAQQSAISQTLGAQQSANFGQMAASQPGTYALAGQQTLGQIAQAGGTRNAPLAAKIAAELGRRGELTATDLAKLRSAEQVNQIDRAGLGIKQETAANEARRNQITAANDAATQRNRAAAIRVTQQNDLASQALRAAQLNEKSNNDAASQAYHQAALNLKAATSGNKAGARPLTAHENNEMNQMLGEAEALIHQAQTTRIGADGKPTTSGGRIQSEAEIRAHLQSGQNPSKKAFDPVLIQAAYELLGWGYVTPQTARAMHAMGMRGGTYNGQPIQVVNPKAPNPLLPSGGGGLPPAGANPFG